LVGIAQLLENRVLLFRRSVRDLRSFVAPRRNLLLQDVTAVTLRFRSLDVKTRALREWVRFGKDGFERVGREQLISTELS
jgi:hypothetical protein